MLDLVQEIIDEYNNGNMDSYSLLCRICFEDVDQKKDIISKLSTRNEILLTLLQCIENDYTWNMEGIGMTEAIIEKLSEQFKCLPNLSRLSLGRNNISPEGIETLCKELKVAPNLIELDLNHNMMGENGLSTLCHSFSCISSLRKLNISCIFI